MPTIEPAGIGTFITNTVNTKTPTQILEKMQADKAPAPNAPADVATSPPAEAPKVPTEDEKRFQALTIKEKQLLRRQQDLQKKEDEMRMRYRPWEEASQVAKESKIEALKRLGISYDDVTNEFLGAQSLTPEQVAEAKAAAIVEQRLKEFQETQEKNSKEQHERQYEAARRQITADAKSITETSQNYPLVKATEAFDTIFELMEKTHGETDRVMLVEEAIKQVETDLKTYVMDLAKIPEIRSELQALFQSEETVKQSIKTEKSPTLTNKMTQSPLAAQDVSTMTASQKEAYYRARAIAAIEGRLG